MFEFTEDDFSMCWHSDGLADQAAKAANAKLKEWLDSAPTVYGFDNEIWSIDRDESSRPDTKKAKLVMIMVVRRRE